MHKGFALLSDRGSDRGFVFQPSNRCGSLILHHAEEDHAGTQELYLSRHPTDLDKLVEVVDSAAMIFTAPT